jgi:hypothetical protein
LVYNVTIKPLKTNQMNNLKKSILFVSIVFSNAFQAQSIKTITGFHHLESVASEDRNLYVADIGKDLAPQTKDGDGAILKLDAKGNILEANFVKEKLNAPKGLAIYKGILWFTDIDRILAIDIKTGNKLYEIDFSKESSFLNDIAVWDANTLYVSATDISKLFKVNLLDKTYLEVVLDKTIAGINGLYCAKKGNILFVNGIGSNNKANGVVGAVNLKNNKVTQLTTYEGIYDGLAVVNETLYVSNWVAFEKKGTLLSIDLNSKRLKTLPMPEHFSGPADFIIDGNTIVLPAMITGELHFIPFNNSLTQKL